MAVLLEGGKQEKSIVFIYSSLSEKWSPNREQLDGQTWEQQIEQEFMGQDTGEKSAQRTSPRNKHRGSLEPLAQN